MKPTLFSLLVLMAATAHAQSAEGEPKNRVFDPKGDRKRPMEFWKKADTNSDQKISKEEFIQLPRISPLPAEKQDKLFVHLDKDQNGTLDMRELMPMGGPNAPDGAPPEEMKRRPMPRIAEMDTDGDKKISFEEFVASEMIAKLPEERQRKFFDNMDRNKDGVLSPEDGPPPGQGMRRPDGKPEGRPDGKPEGKPNKNPDHTGMPNPERMFGAADANQDKLVDFTEFQKSPVATRMGEDAQEDLFESMDTNKDQKLDQTEWQQLAEKRKATPDKPRDTPKRPTPDAADEDEMMMKDGI